MGTASTTCAGRLYMQGASTTSGATTGGAVYETSRAVGEYLQFHYASDEELMPFAFAPKDALGFVARLAGKCSRATGRERALDIGCSVGGASFELCKEFESVIGIDFSQAFVDTATQMAADGAQEYTSLVTGSITEKCVARVAPDIDRSRATFMQGDACALPEELGRFDAVLAANLLCRLPQPHVFLQRCEQLVKPGGVLVLVSPYSWLEQYTPREHWLGGDYDENGQVKDSAKTVASLLSNRFTLVEEEDMPFLMREHVRKYAIGVSHGTVWRRNSEE